MQTIQFLEACFVQAVPYAIGQVESFEIKLAQSLISLGRAIEHKGDVATSDETNPNPPSPLVETADPASNPPVNPNPVDAGATTDSTQQAPPPPAANLPKEGTVKALMDALTLNFADTKKLLNDKYNLDVQNAGSIVETALFSQVVAENKAK